MSLLVINSSSRVAGGLIKGLAKNGQYDRIVCADLLPNYKAIERFINLQQEVSSKDRLVDLKITGKSSLEDAIHQADQVVYVTHEYSQNVPSKTSMFDNVVKMMAEEFPDKKVRFPDPDRVRDTIGVRPLSRA